MKNYFFERDKKTSKKSRSLEKKFFFHQILLFIAYYTQIEYLGSFIPHDRVLNTPVAYDLYFNHKQLLKIQKLIQKLIYHLFCKLTDYPKKLRIFKEYFADFRSGGIKSYFLSLGIKSNFISRLYANKVKFQVFIGDIITLNVE